MAAGSYFFKPSLRDDLKKYAQRNRDDKLKEENKIKNKSLKKTDYKIKLKRKRSL